MVRGTLSAALCIALAATGDLAAAQSQAAGPASAAAGPAGGPTVSILYFDNLAKSADFDWLGIGLSDMLTTDLASSRLVTVVERERLAKVLKEQELQLSGLTRESDAVRVGEILAVKDIVYGSYVVAGSSLRIEARLVDTRSAAVLAAVGAEGTTGEVLGLERKVAAGLLAALEPGAGPGSPTAGTEVQDAAAAYYRGLAELDAGAYQAATAHFQAAAGLDPAYPKPQAGLEAAYRFLKDFKRQRERHEMAAIAASLQRLRSRVEGPFYSFGDMVRRPRDFGFADAQAAYTSDPRGYSGDSPVQAMWNMQMLFLEMGQKAVDYFSETTLADRCDRQILDLAAAAEARYPKDPFLPECLYAALLPLRRESRWAELKSACERLMTGWPDYRMASSVEEMYQTALDKLSGKG
ncbi:MAG: FlgO family outer membrane protein [Treponema sp.]|nr:FlgO family outer membrane protein [Treponema sp.]